MDSDMAHSSGMGLDGPKASSGSKGHTNQHRLQISMWFLVTVQTTDIYLVFLVVTQATDVDTDTSFIMDTDMAFGHSQGQDLTLVSSYLPVLHCHSVSSFPILHSG